MLYVPALAKTLWSITQFAAEGHIVIFGTKIVIILMNNGQLEEIHLVIPHPLYQISCTPSPFAMAATACPYTVFAALSAGDFSGLIDINTDNNVSSPLVH
jgi:hypothetical protein